MIQSKKNSEHYIWGNSCDSWVIKDSPCLSVKQEIMPAGSAEKLHFHETAEQVFYILKGDAVLHINNKQYKVRAGESISVPPQSDYISNESQEEVEFLVISSPSTNNDRIEIKQ